MADYSGFIVSETITLATPTSANANILIGATTTQYAQRVWSTGLGVWCYYVGPLNPTPLPAQTTPNWTGSIQRHQNLGPV